MIFSAVLHADERNRRLSEELGRDVYSYHLHITYVPTVEKDILWTKRVKDKSLVGIVKERITQISHSKKWWTRKKLDENGDVVYKRDKDGNIKLNKDGKPKPELESAYSGLQDRIYQHMTEVGFPNLTRGVKGSKKNHLYHMEFKAEQEALRVDEAKARADVLYKGNIAAQKKFKKAKKDIENMEADLAALDETYGRAANLINNHDSVALRKNIHKDNSFINSLAPKKSITGKQTLTISGADVDKAMGLMREAVESRDIIPLLRVSHGQAVKNYENLERDTALYSQAYNMNPQAARDALDKVIRDCCDENRRKGVAAPSKSSPKFTRAPQLKDTPVPTIVAPAPVKKRKVEHSM